MTRKLLSQPFEIGLVEKWQWSTDVLVGVTNIEQRIARRVYPRETINARIRFGVDGQSENPSEVALNGKDAIVRSIRDLALSENELTLPMWQYSDQPAIGSWTVSTSTLSFTMAGLTPFFGFAGEGALVQFGDSWFRGTILAYNTGTRVGSIIFATATGASILGLRLIVPLRDALANSMGQTQGRASDFASVSISATLSAGANRNSVSGLDGSLYTNPIAGFSYPILLPRIQTSDLDLRIDHGTQTVDNITAFPFYNTQWAQPKYSFKIKDVVNRYDRSDDWADWKTLLQNLRGSQSVFFVPTRRSDFAISSVPSASSIILLGRQFFDLWNETNLKAIALDNGVDLIRIRQVVFCELDDNGNSSCQLESTTGLSILPIQVSIAFPCRISGDEVTLTHDSNTTTIEFGVETVHFTFTPQLLSTPLVELRTDDLTASIISSEFDTLTNTGSLGGTFNAPASANRPLVSYWRSRRSADFLADDAIQTSLAVSNFNFLIADNSNYTLVVRFEVISNDGSTDRFLVSSTTSPFLRIKLNPNNSITVDRRGRVFTSAVGLVEVGGRYTLVLGVTPTADRLYLSGPITKNVQIGISTATVGANVAMGSAFGFGRTTSFNARSRVSHAIVYPTVLSLTQREYIRGVLETLWPDRDPVLFQYMADDPLAVFSSSEFNSIPATGEYSGTMLAQSTGLQDEPNLTSLNSKRSPLFTGGEFDPKKAASSVPFLWASADRGVVYSGLGLNIGVGLQEMTIAGTGNADFPHIQARSVDGGEVGFAFVQFSVDAGATWLPSVQSAVSMTVGPFAVGLTAGVTLSAGAIWSARAQTINDQTNQANNLVKQNSGFALWSTYRAGRLAFLPTAVAYFGRSLLTNSRAVSGPMTMVLVGNFGASPASKILTGGVNFMRDIRTDSGSLLGLVSTVVATLVSAVTANKDFIIIGSWNGVTSTLRVIQDGLSDLSGTVNPGDPAGLALTQLAWGAHMTGVNPALGYKMAAIYAGDGLINAADLEYLTEGFKLEYEFTSNFASDYIDASLLGGNSQLTFLHNNTQNYQISFALAIGNLLPTAQPTVTLFEAVTSGGFGVRCTATFGNGSVNASLSFSILGTGSPFTTIVDLGKPGPGYSAVVEIKFTSGGSSQVVAVVDDMSQAASLAGAMSYSVTAQGNPLRVGKGRGFAIPEMIIRSDFTSQSLYLRDKWFPKLWGNALMGLGPTNPALTNPENYALTS